MVARSLWDAANSPYSVLTAATRLAGQQTSDATTGQPFDASLLGFMEQTTASPTSGNVSATRGMFYGLSLSGLTADRNFTLPANARVGEMVGFSVTSGHATNEINIHTAASGDTIDGRDCSSAVWRKAWRAGEGAIFLCTVNAGAGAVDWVTIHNSVAPPFAFITGDGDATTQSLGSSSYTAVTGNSSNPLQTVVGDRYGFYTASTGSMLPSIPGLYQFTAALVAGSVADGKRVIAYFGKNWTSGAGSHIITRSSSSAAGHYVGGNGSVPIECNGSTDFVKLIGFCDDTTARDVTPGSNDLYFGCQLIREFT